ncbi:hypothetical protein MPTK1_4g03810 [Marchantia polymorpha subsp. ruderalis]|uniref:Uncharacterized protein n=2 Tax=Marchantia polymorpha TaxID=3197 RepID=A0AAF6B5Z9_MARPO|nr:hypothetical protein MARPO_0044s0093 [Marchantia polymorpha]BBN07433.1 hypothetical protein Mp_4g03810 [Marchantia polymorpha subsp. ruderalis]|eukprot:PTQ39668.1 hypothetical protein MARPO_0044s0093 [Marchantia polymorpha]
MLFVSFDLHQGRLSKPFQSVVFIRPSVCTGHANSIDSLPCLATSSLYQQVLVTSVISEVPFYPFCSKFRRLVTWDKFEHLRDSTDDKHRCTGRDVV